MKQVWKKTNNPNNHNPSSSSSLRSIILQDFLNSPSSSPSPPPPPATVLSLNSSVFPNDDDHQDEEHLHLEPFDALASSFMASFGKKRLSQGGNGVLDRRNKRMMMNRESAARSRARKQAYINDLELENARLTAENAALKLQHHQQMLQQAEPVAHQIPHKKRPLQRTSTAPF